MTQEPERRSINQVHDKGLTLGVNLNNVLTALVIAVLVGLYNGNEKINSRLEEITRTQTLIVYRVQLLEQKAGGGQVWGPLPQPRKQNFLKGNIQSERKIDFFPIIWPQADRVIPYNCRRLDRDPGVLPVFTPGLRKVISDHGMQGHRRGDQYIDLLKCWTFTKDRIPFGVVAPIMAGSVKPIIVAANLSDLPGLAPVQGGDR